MTIHRNAENCLQSLCKKPRLADVCEDSLFDDEFRTRVSDRMVNIYSTLSKREWMLSDSRDPCLYLLVIPSRILADFCSKKEDHFYYVGKENISVTPLCCSFTPNGRSIAIADDEGTVHLESAYGAKDSSTHFSMHNNSILDIDFPSTHHLATASADHSVHVIDMSTELRSLEKSSTRQPMTVKRCTSLEGHTGSVRTIRHQPLNHSPHILLTASRDNQIMLWDTRCRATSETCLESHETQYSIHSPIRTVRQAHQKKMQSDLASPRTRSQRAKVSDRVFSVSAAEFTTDHCFLSIGASDGYVKLWDWRFIGKASSLPTASLCISSSRGLISLCMNQQRSRSYLLSCDSRIYEIDNATMKVLYTYSCPLRASSFDIKLAMSCDDRYLLSGNQNGSAILLDLGEKHKSYALAASKRETMSVACHPMDTTLLATCADDQMTKLWRIDGKLSRQMRLNDEHDLNICESTVISVHAAEDDKKNVASWKSDNCK